MSAVEGLPVVSCWGCRAGGDGVPITSGAPAARTPQHVPSGSREESNGTSKQIQDEGWLLEWPSVLFVRQLQTQAPSERVQRRRPSV